MAPLMWELQAFCSVVEKQSFVAAARLLGRSPSAITRAVQALEEAVGQELLRRSQKLVGLTAAGETYYTYAAEILALHREAEERLVTGEAQAQGWIRFSAPESMAQHRLPEVMARFAQDYPEIHFDVRYVDVPVDPIAENLDFAIRGAFPQSSELHAFRLWAYTRHLYASPAYLARRGTPTTPETLTGHDFIIHTAPRILHDWTLRRADTRYRLNWQARHRVSSGTALYHATLQGMGIARLADWLCIEAVARGELVQLCPDWRLTSSAGADPQMHAVYAGNRLPQRARLFLNALREAGRLAGA
jgi:DNA-binding transcriptional LysR family regulator